MRLKNKVVFITDADSKSGKAITRRLAAEGARFILNSASAGAGIEPELVHCRSVGSETLVCQINLCISAEIQEVLDNAANVLGKVDVLVHNNNLVKRAAVETCEEPLFFEILNANTKTAFIATQAVGRQMTAKRSGSIIYVGSIHAEKPNGSSFAYSAAKGAVKMLSREASLMLGRHGVRVNHIEMGPVEGDDERFRSDISLLYEDFNYKVPGAVLGTHRDLADLVLFLAGDEAGYLNGADIRLDGGFLNHYIDVKMNKPE
ncbi:SDR family NAD(P)-dependent oxidoreductase [Paenibacillus tarimensis]